MEAERLTFGPSDTRFASTVASLVHATGPEVFDFVYGGDGRSLDMLRRLCAHEDGIFGSVHTTAAYDGGRLLGIEHGFDTPTKAAHDRATAGHLRAMLSRDELRRVAWADDILSALFPPQPAGAYYIQNLSVLPEFRGRGVGARLLRQAFGRAREAGCDSVQLDVSITNPAVEFYLREGMEIEHERRHPEYERAHRLKGQYRMIERFV